MAPIPRLGHDKPLAPGQATIFSALNGSLALAKAVLTPPLRQGPKARTTRHSRRLVGGLNEKQVVETFANAQLQLDLVELGDEDIVEGVINDGLDDTKGDYILVYKQHAYT
jgi:hypothetical protein